MKKVTLLVASVLCALGSYAQSSIEQLPAELSKTTYQLVTPRGTLYYDKTVEESYLTSNCMTGRNQNVNIGLGDTRGQFLVIPTENNNMFYLYSVEAGKFVNHSGVRAGLTDEPTEIAMWAHGQTATGSQAYNHSQFSYADYPFTIADEYVEGVTVNDGKHLNSINICCWESANPDYRWCDTSHYDDGNAFKVVEAGELDLEAYNNVRVALGLDPEVVAPVVPEDAYPVNFDKETNLGYNRSDRPTTSVSIIVDGEAQSIIVEDQSIVYRDLSEQFFTVKPGATVNPKIGYKGEWMHGYLYLDTNCNYYFDVNADNYMDETDELVSFTFYSPTNASTGKNSAGENKSNNCNAKDLPAFTAPTEPGEYRMRYIVDWNCIDPAGQYGSKYSGNYINANKGCIIDVTLKVEAGETPVDPEPPVVEPEELTWSPVEAGSIYAIVNLQPTGNNFYLDYLEGNLSPVPAGECNTLYEWPETAKFQAVKLADGRFAFKNCGTGNYLAWKGTANRNNTTGVYNNQGYDPAINEHSSWTLNESTRYEGAYWLRAEQRNDIPGDGQNLTGSPIIGNDGAWNAWTTGEYLPANGTAFSNSFAFYLIEKPEAPVYDYAAAIAPVLAEANEVLEGHDNVWVTTISDKLITRNNQFSSPNSDPSEGSTNNLLDGSANTFWHSNWHNGNQPAHSHYLQVALDEAIDGDVLLTFVRRNAANDQVTRLDVETSMDGENFTHAAYIDMPNSGAGKTEQKVFALEEKAKFLRFWADATTDNRGYWHVGDFQLQTSKTELNIDAPDYAYPTAVKDLQDAIAATPTADGTEADVEALQAAIEAYKAALAGYPEFTEWNGEIAINVGEVKSIDDLLNVDFIFNRAANIERGYSVLGAIFDQTGDAYGLVLDGFCGDVDYKTVKNAELVAKVASVEFAKISDFVGDVQAQAKAAAAKIGAFQPEAGHAYVLIASKSFLVDGELFNEFKKFDCTLATGVITGVETIVVPASEVMFDLQGRRTNSTNGLRILNGRVVR
ncbi:MAG: discoidin domain-containing protein [Bacteroidales bacterium]|nr:discoidin domain-containing protein [Bacteroidales bacterium]